MKDLRQRLLATFRVEHTEHLQRIRETLAALASSGNALAAPELDEVFRRAHSLKGAARAVDLRPLEHLAHRLETLFSRVREGAMQLDASVIKLIQQVLDASEDWLAAYGGATEPAAPVEALDAIERLVGPKADGVPKAPVTTPQKENVSAPAPAAAPLAAVDTLRLNAASLDRIVSSAGQLLTESLRQTHVTRSLRHVADHLAETAAERDRVRRSGARVFQKLDTAPELASVARYVNYLDHQIHVLTRQVGAAVQLQEKNAWALRSLAGELQRDVRQARMVPAENVFDGFRKMVRDLARDAGKTIDLHVSGWQVEADRIVLEALRDPVMHMLRNAIAHGLEPEAERKRAGKHPEGRIDLVIDASGNQLNVSVEDDGRGVDVATVAAVATKKGLIAESAVATLSSPEVMRLILLPGFSTSRSVNDLSGRGMGLSVVAEAVARLQGKVDIGPGRHGGTRVSVTAPLSVSSHRLLLVTCQGQTLAVPLHAVERLRRVKLADVQTIEGRPVIMADGRPISVVSLAQLLHAEAPNVSANENVLCVMIMRAGAERLAVAVDSFLSERDAIIRELPAPADANPQLAGGVLLEDGSVCLVLSPAEIVKAFRTSSGSLVLAPGSAVTETEKKPFEILVVDDSLTTRTLEKSVLEAHGYQVAIAVDGVDALNYLRAGHVGLVISDVEMPRLDGFGLLKEMKGDPRLAKIPVIIVSSIEHPEDQARGLTLGADAYVVKRKFDQQELLDTIRQIV